MKAKDLKDKTAEELAALEKDVRTQLFENRFKNFTNRLDDTSLIRKNRKDIARVKTLHTQAQKKAGS